MLSTAIQLQQVLVSPLRIKSAENRKPSRCKDTAGL